MTKLEEMIILAQHISYREPTNTNIDEWTSMELIHKSIHIALQNNIQIRAGLYMCNQFPPLKLIYKSILSGYIKHFTNLNSVIT